MKKRHRRLTVAAAGLLTLSILPLQVSQAFAATNDDTTTLRMPIYKSAPITDLYDGDDLVKYNTQEGLMRFDPKDPNGGVVNGLADSYKISADGKTYAFHLRDNLKWSDGQPIVADDFVAGYERVQKSGLADLLNTFHITGLNAPDERTVVVTFSEQGIDLLKVFGGSTIVPVERAFANKQGGQFASSPVTTTFSGPFVVQEVTNDHVLLVKNPNYWDDQHVSLNRVVLFLNLNTQDAARLYQEGVLDEAGIGNTNGLFFKQEEKVLLSPAYEKFLIFNSKSGLLQNANIRKALQLALPPKPYGSFSVDGFVPNAIAGVGSDFRSTHPYTIASNADEAKVSLAEGLKELNLTKLPTLQLDEDRSSDLSWMSVQWKQVLGIDVNVVQSAESNISSRFNSGQAQISELNWMADYNDPADFLDVFQSQEGYYKADYSNATFNSELASASGEQDPTKRMNDLAAAEQTLLNDNAMIPLYQESFLRLVHPYVQLVNLGWTDLYDFKASSKSPRPQLHVTSFADYSNIPNYSSAAIDQLLNEDVVHGTDQSHFSPNQPITREEFAALLVKGMGLPFQTSSKQFTDLTNQNWSYPYVQTAVANGIIHGYQNGNSWAFNPGAPITRAEMATMLNFALNLKAGSTSTNFTDVKGTWAQDYILAAQNAGLLYGYEDNTFRPDHDTIRADAAVVIERALNKIPLPPIDPSLLNNN